MAFRSVFTSAQLASMAVNNQSGGLITNQQPCTGTPFYRIINATPLQLLIVDDNNTVIDLIVPNSRLRGHMGRAGDTAQWLIVIFDPTRQTQTTAFTQTGAWVVYIEFSDKPFKDSS